MDWIDWTVEFGWWTHHSRHLWTQLRIIVQTGQPVFADVARRVVDVQVDEIDTAQDTHRFVPLHHLIAIKCYTIRVLNLKKKKSINSSDFFLFFFCVDCWECWALGGSSEATGDRGEGRNTFYRTPAKGPLDAAIAAWITVTPPATGN